MPIGRAQRGCTQCAHRQGMEGCKWYAYMQGTKVCAGCICRQGTQGVYMVCPLAGHRGGVQGVTTGRTQWRSFSRWAFRGAQIPLHLPPTPPLFRQVANPDGDFRLTIINSSVLDRPRALVLVPQEG